MRKSDFVKKEIMHLFVSFLIFLLTILTLYYFSFKNIKFPKQIGIDIYVFVFCFSIYYFIFILCTYLIFKRNIYKHLAIYSFLGYTFVLMLLLFFLSNVINKKYIYFSTLEHNFHKEYLKSKYNLIPFYIMRFKNNSTTFLGYIFNVICFIPFGFLLPYISYSFNKQIKKITYVFLFLFFTITIEVLQYLLPINRVADIDDIISNFIGSIIGFLVYNLIKSFVLERSCKNDIKKSKSHRNKYRK